MNIKTCCRGMGNFYQLKSKCREKKPVPRSAANVALVFGLPGA
jgi:hypothetical protein